MKEKQKLKYLIKGGMHDDLKFVGETDDVFNAKLVREILEANGHKDLEFSIREFLKYWQR